MLPALSDSGQWTIKAIRRWAPVFLQNKLPDSPALDCQILLQFVCNLSSSQLITHDERALTEGERQFFLELLTRRSQGEPVAYLVGSQEFYGLKFVVNPAVLIPRPETELIIDLLRADFSSESSLSLVDIGTGSGCLAVTIKHLFPHATVVGWDISSEALAVARSNAKQNGVDVAFQEVDVLNGAAWAGKFNVIVSNPPYIPFNEAEGLSVSVKNYEPHKALFAPSGLEFYKAIAQHGGKCLISGGKFYLEVGAGQAPAVKAILDASGYAGITSHKDLAGHDRIVTGHKL